MKRLHAVSPGEMVHMTQRGPQGHLADHRALLESARLVQAAAAESDTERLRRESRRLLAQLDGHLANDRHHLDELPPDERRTLAAGQDELLRTAAALATLDPPLGTAPTGPARRLLAQLHVQCERERRLLAHR